MDGQKYFRLAMASVFVGVAGTLLIYLRAKNRLFRETLEQIPLPVIIGLVSLALCFVAWKGFFVWRAVQRSQMIRRCAEDCGAVFLGRPDSAPNPLCAVMDGLIQQFTDHPRNLILRESAALQIAVFDYQWVSKARDDCRKTLERRTAVCVVHSLLDLPPFELAPNRLLTRMLQSSKKAIHFDGHPAFVRRYNLRADDPTDIHRWFHPGVVQLIETESQSYFFIGSGAGFIFRLDKSGFFGNGHAVPSDFSRLMQFGDALSEQFLVQTTGDTPPVDAEIIDEQ